MHQVLQVKFKHQLLLCDCPNLQVKSMSKNRPIKNFRIEGERPFKMYNPGISPSALQFPDTTRLDIALPAAASIFMQHQHDRRRQQQQQQQRHVLTRPQNQSSQVYDDPASILSVDLQPQQIPAVSSERQTYAYDDLDLRESGNSLTRPDQMAQSQQLIPQRQQDLDIPSSVSINSPLGAMSSFVVPNRPFFRSQGESLVLGSDAISMMIDHHMSSYGPSLSRSVDATCIASSSSLSMAQFSQNSLPQFHGISAHRGHNLSLTSDNLDDVKLEIDMVVSSIDENSATSTNSPSQKEVDKDEAGKPQKHSQESDLSECSTSSVPVLHEQASTSRYGPSGSGDKTLPSMDPCYQEKRRKNNESARRSREARRSKEELIAFRVISLEEENMKLRAEISLLDRELDDLRMRLYQGN